MGCRPSKTQQKKQAKEPMDAAERVEVTPKSPAKGTLLASPETEGQAPKETGSAEEPEPQAESEVKIAAAAAVAERIGVAVTAVTAMTGVAVVPAQGSTEAAVVECVPVVDDTAAEPTTEKEEEIPEAEQPTSTEQATPPLPHLPIHVTDQGVVASVEEPRETEGSGAARVLLPGTVPTMPVWSFRSCCDWVQLGDESDLRVAANRDMPIT
eukprot:CAMPEP_0170618272 /NCGR_PEP_ID=MMETSP0224-20130122/26871_1 /TAXON_ID=285029 /ORGANISM="Togula jolla, Strain CCCM 725" /LENGTH=210 /DNA_ID=CAMNT_0010944237 /DNA_START=158 /DNA_END=790 /DNA_ORIENTATION=-